MRKKINVVGSDVNKAKIYTFLARINPTKEVGNDEIKNTTVEFTCDPAALRDAKFHIVAVPTPIKEYKTPDLKPVIGASELLGKT